MRIYIIGHDGVALCPRRRRLSMTARLSSRRKKNCTPLRSVPNGFWHCGTRCPASIEAEGWQPPDAD